MTYHTEETLRFAARPRSDVGLPGMPRMSPILSYREEFGQKLFDRIMRSRQGATVLKALNLSEAVLNDQRALFDIFVAEDNIHDGFSNRLPCAGGTKYRPKVSPRIVSDYTDMCLVDNNIVRDQRDKESLPPLRAFAGINTYFGMFYSRNVYVNVHYLQKNLGSINSSARLLGMLMRETETVMNYHEIEGVIHSIDPRNFTRRLVDYRSDNLTSAEVNLCRQFPISIDHFIMKHSLVLAGPHTKKLLQDRIVAFNKHIVSILDTRDTEKILSYY